MSSFKLSAIEIAQAKAGNNIFWTIVIKMVVSDAMSCNNGKCR